MQIVQVSQVAREYIRKSASFGIHSEKWKSVIEMLDFVIFILRGGSNIKERFQVSLLVRVEWLCLTIDLPEIAFYTWNHTTTN
jgi:hypothetical protein